MGYCYEGRKLCCDHCGVAGGVRKRRCKYNYCPPPALCATCWKENRPQLRESCEARCKPASDVLNAREEMRQKLLGMGYFLRTSAVCTANEQVQVWFRNSEGAEQTYTMHRLTYNAIGLATPATPFCFGKHGPVQKVAA